MSSSYDKLVLVLLLVVTALCIYMVPLLLQLFRIAAVGLLAAAGMKACTAYIREQEALDNCRDWLCTNRPGDLKGWAGKRR